MKPYFAADGVTLYLGDCREIVPALEMKADVVIADPPYGETSLAWDRWPVGWVDAVGAGLKPSGSLWCFGSMRMFLARAGEFSGWKFAQDVVWEKQNGSGFAKDRFKRVHEVATHWYRGEWGDVLKATPTTPDATKRQVRRKQRPPHLGIIDGGSYESIDGGPRLMRSVIRVANCHGYAENETQKPEGIVRPLVQYSCPPGGLVLSPFAGSGTDLVVARSLGMRAIGIEAREQQCEVIVKRLAQGVLLAG